MRTWSASQDEMMFAFYPCNTMATMKALTGKTECAIYNRANTLNLKKTQEYLDSPSACRLKRGHSDLSIANQFKKGFVPWNKGMKGLKIGGERTQFKKGSTPQNYKPVGYIRETVDGYFEIKMAEGMQKFKLLHRVVWERLNGAIPKGMNLIFLDGNKQNIEITNLSLVTKAQNMKRNSYHENYPKEIQQLIQLRGAINRQINKRNANEHQHA